MKFVISDETIAEVRALRLADEAARRPLTFAEQFDADYRQALADLEGLTPEELRALASREVARCSILGIAAMAAGDVPTGTAYLAASSLFASTLPKPTPKPA